MAEFLEKSIKSWT